MNRNDSAWNRFLDDIQKAREDLQCAHGSQEEAWFRGHTNSTYTLLPSLFRRFDDPNGQNWENVWNVESDLYWEFSARARELHGTTDSDWDFVFAMQHHGTPTRLLDWTEVLGVAIYFAISGVDDLRIQGSQGKPPASPCIWVLNPNQLNLASDWHCEDLVSPKNLGWDSDENELYDYEDILLEEGIGWDWPIAIYPRHKTNRIHAQRGWFTIHGDEFKPLEEFGNKDRFLRKVELPFDAFKGARDFLGSAGLDHYSLFPDLDNLSRHLRQKYRL